MDFGLVVREAFDERAPGEVVTDPKQVAAIWSDARRNNVSRFLLPDEVKAEQTAEKPAPAADEHQGA